MENGLRVLKLIEFLVAAGVFGATLTFIGQALTGWRQRRRERHGLLKILQVEVSQNRFQAQYFIKDPDALRNTFIPGWESTVWAENAARLAQLIQESDFEALVSCYASTKVVQIHRAALLAPLAEDAENADRENDAAAYMNNLQQRFLPEMESTANNAMSVINKRL